MKKDNLHESLDHMEKSYPQITREGRVLNHYSVFIKLKDVKGDVVHDTRTVWSCDELELWVDYDKDEKPLGIQVMFNKKLRRN